MSAPLSTRYSLELERSLREKERDVGVAGAAGEERAVRTLMEEVPGATAARR